MKSIEFVYFDLGNVLARFSVQRACQNVARRWNVEPDLVHQSLWLSGAQDRFEHGHEDDESFALLARTALGLADDHAATVELLDHLSDMFDPIQEMEAIVESVRAGGTRVGILSNTCIAHWRWLQAAGYPALRGPFDAVILSYEVGAMKPAAKIYEVAQREAGVSAGSILFLDDRVENVQAAQALGWNAHLFTDATSARELLRWQGLIN